MMVDPSLAWRYTGDELIACEEEIDMPDAQYLNRWNQ